MSSKMLKIVDIIRFSSFNFADTIMPGFRSSSLRYSGFVGSTSFKSAIYVF